MPTAANKAELPEVQSQMCGNGRGHALFKDYEREFEPFSAPEKLLTRRASWLGWPLHSTTGSFRHMSGEDKMGKAPSPTGEEGTPEACPGPR